jgi:hypothetical protein
MKMFPLEGHDDDARKKNTQPCNGGRSKFIKKIDGNNRADILRDSREDKEEFRWRVLNKSF